MKYFWIILTASALGVSAQDTIRAIEVRAYPYQKFALGAKVWHADSLLLLQNSGSQLSEYLMRFSGIYLKEYGNTMLGAISLRGTGAGHTAVLWNGVNINSPTLGESDFANIPVFSQNQINVQFGSAGSLFGTEAIGGAVLLSSFDTDDPTAQRIHFRKEIGSFGRNFSALSFAKNQEKIQVRASAYHLNLPNNYPIPVLLGRGENQNSVNYLGASQDVRYQINDQHSFTIHSWYHSNFRKLSNGATLQDNNLRLLGSWENNLSNTITLQSKVGYTNDFMLYNQADITQTQRLLGIVQVEKQWQKISLQAGLNSQYFAMNVDAYGKARQEWRNDAFLLLRWQVLPFWAVSFNQRQTWVAGYQVPFTPSLGSELVIKNAPKERIVWKLQANAGYRVPTLNSRYWQPGGNAKLKPEHSLSAETGIAWEQKNNSSHLKAEITAFMMRVRDWILWQPTPQGFWSPDNLQNVQARGIEGQVVYRYQSPHWRWHFWGNYSLTASQIVSLRNDVSGRFKHKFLPYTPLQRVSAGAIAAHRTWQFSTNAHFTDQRFSDLDNLTRLKNFWLLDAHLQKKFFYQQHEWQVGVQANNLMNQQYQNVQNQWMPMRNYQVNISWTIR